MPGTCHNKLIHVLDTIRSKTWFFLGFRRPKAAARGWLSVACHSGFPRLLEIHKSYLVGSHNSKTDQARTFSFSFFVAIVSFSFLFLVVSFSLSGVSLSLCSIFLTSRVTWRVTKVLIGSWELLWADIHKGFEGFAAA